MRTRYPVRLRKQEIYDPMQSNLEQIFLPAFRFLDLSSVAPRPPGPLAMSTESPASARPIGKKPKLIPPKSILTAAKQIRAKAVEFFTVGSIRPLHTRSSIGLGCYTRLLVKKPCYLIRLSPPGGTSSLSVRASGLLPRNPDQILSFVRTEAARSSDLARVPTAVVRVDLTRNRGPLGVNT
jgi:hypothetical protein